MLLILIHLKKLCSEAAHVYSLPTEVTTRPAKPTVPTIPAPTLPEAAPDPLHFPPPPTELGKFRETITKQTLTETVVTRHTSNQKGQFPVITEVFIVSIQLQQLIKQLTKIVFRACWL